MSDPITVAPQEVVELHTFTVFNLTIPWEMDDDPSVEGVDEFELSQEEAEELYEALSIALGKVEDDDIIRVGDTVSYSWSKVPNDGWYGVVVGIPNGFLDVKRTKPSTHGTWGNWTASADSPNVIKIKG